MSENPTEKTPRGPLRAFTDWLKGAPTAADAVATPPREGGPRRIGHYRITGRLGQGGMGIVYAALDEKLHRAVAIKTMAMAGDEAARRRFWREARAVASVNHPNVCQLYEIGEDGGELFLAMELLEGEPLAERLRRGPCDVAEATSIALGILAALTALHTRGVIHRDLKPSNVFLTPHGVKLLDFGLARPSTPELERTIGSAADLTHAGMVVGTPRYMAPEQVRGEEVDARIDLFAAGAIVFEMLAGRPAFGGRNVVEILHATLSEQPPALTGSPAIAAVDRVIRRALAKDPARRFATADAMAAELRGVRDDSGGEAPALARPLTRLVVLPFRVLRADPETDFLAFSLPDAIATSLSGFGSLIVRSSAVAARFAGEAPDLKALAAEADVDRVVMGTLLRAGDQVRATAQLVEAPAGTLLTSQSIQASLGDLFRLQDDIARRVVEALALPLGGASPTVDAPRDAQAYALYLRANAIAATFPRLPEARDLYQRCVELDPRFAPAWAKLGRCHWVIAKFLEASPDGARRAEEALRRALELSPHLPVAHKYWANLDADRGRTEAAIVRLLDEASRHGNDPELFAGLVHACRYCGLYEASIAAHAEARRLDPNVTTSVEQTILMTADFERLIAFDRPENAGADAVIRIVGLGLAGRREEALAPLHTLDVDTRIPVFGPWARFLGGWLQRDVAEMRRQGLELGGLEITNDPEAIFQQAWFYADAGDPERALELLDQSIGRGYFVAPTLERAPHFDALRARPEFQRLLAAAAAGRARALTAFREHGGEKLLGIGGASPGQPPN